MNINVRILKTYLKKNGIDTNSLHVRNKSILDMYDLYKTLIGRNIILKMYYELRPRIILISLKTRNIKCIRFNGP